MNDSQSADDLAGYLNDHLAGSVGALELIEHVREKMEGTDLARFMKELHEDVNADQEILKNLLGRLGHGESTIRKAGAWLAEKVGQARLGLGHRELKGSGLLEALEVLALGITGKQLLWRALGVITESHPELGTEDFEVLEQRALAQREKVERFRLAAAREAFRIAS